VVAMLSWWAVPYPRQHLRLEGVQPRMQLHLFLPPQLGLACRQPRSTTGSVIGDMSTTKSAFRTCDMETSSNNESILDMPTTLEHD
jgi:hypothetical protein